MADFYRVFCGALFSEGTRRENVALIIEGGRIAAWESLDALPERVSSPDVDAHSGVVLPGMIDIHVHGGGGRDLMDGEPETIQFVAKHLAKHGVTGFLVTPLTAPWQAIQKVVSATEQVQTLGSDGAEVLGCHLEGPYINLKYKGAQPPEYILPASVAEFERWIGDGMDTIRIVTLAPEIEGGYDLIQFLSQQDIIVSLGHTDARYDEVSRAIDLGARHVTHCFCAMRPMHHRDPGATGAALSRPELKAELIWDNIHVQPPVVRVLLAAKGLEGVIGISDGTTGVGMPEGYTFELFGHGAVVRGGVARLAGQEETLAGSAIAMDSCLINAQESVGLEAASLILCANPARALGLEGQKGTLRVGADADFFLWNPDKKQVEATYVMGRKVA